MGIYDLPAVNATLNGISTMFIIGGLVCIKAGKKRGHIACMASALLTSAAFLACYLVYHYYAGSVKFTYEGSVVRTIYFALLISHIILAALILPLVVMTVVPALRRRFEKHKRVARWTAPIWLYVSVTGVVIYLMLYRWFPSSDIPGS